MILDLDIPNRVASVRRTYIYPPQLRATIEGNIQVLPKSGNVFVGWGRNTAYTEFSPEGEIPLCDRESHLPVVTVSWAASQLKYLSVKYT